MPKTTRVRLDLAGLVQEVDVLNKVINRCRKIAKQRHVLLEQVLEEALGKGAKLLASPSAETLIGQHKVRARRFHNQRPA